MLWSVTLMFQHVCLSVMYPPWGVTMLCSLWHCVFSVCISGLTHPTVEWGQFLRVSNTFVWRFIEPCSKVPITTGDIGHAYFLDVSNKFRPDCTDIIVLIPNCCLWLQRLDSQPLPWRRMLNLDNLLDNGNNFRFIGMQLYELNFAHTPFVVRPESQQIWLYSICTC